MSIESIKEFLVMHQEFELACGLREYDNNLKKRIVQLHEGNDEKQKRIVELKEAIVNAELKGYSRGLKEAGYKPSIKGEMGQLGNTIILISKMIGYNNLRVRDGCISLFISSFILLVIISSRFFLFLR